VLGGALLGAVVFALIVAWPVLRIIWHWLPEIVVALGVVYGWTWLMQATPLWLALVLVIVGVGVPAAFGPVRHWVLAPAWCLIVRHRLRVCFAAFIATNRTGTLPLILHARPTPAGERVWIWLRPGLSIKDLEQDGQVQKLAVACWANEVRVTRASRKRAALIRVDVARRNPLENKIKSNLPDYVPDNMTDDMTATAPISPAVPPVGVNLADVPHPHAARATTTNSVAPGESRPRRPRNPPPAAPPPDEEPSGFDPRDYAEPPRPCDTYVSTHPRLPGVSTPAGTPPHAGHHPVRPIGDHIMTSPLDVIPVGTGMSIFDPVFLGIDEFGHPVYLPLMYRNILLGGEPGAGKSSLLNTIVGHAALCDDVDLVLIDGKQVELGLWKDCADVFVGPNLDHAIHTLERLQTVMDNRYAYLLSQRRQKITDDDGDIDPLLLAVDELA
jgi:hypothetical protein